MKTLEESRKSLSGKSIFLAIALSVLCCCTNGNKSAVSKESEQEALTEQSHDAIPANLLDEQPLFFNQPANSFVDWVKARFQFPESLKEKKVEGKILVSFVIDENGKMTDVKIEEGLCEELDNEAVRAVSLSPDWTPGKKGGVNAAALYKLPIYFQSNN